jgi:hypothetical protein
VGKYPDLATLSVDYFAVADEDIVRVESLLTVTGGKIGYAAGEYEGLKAPLLAVSPGRSPVAPVRRLPGVARRRPARAGPDRRCRRFGRATALAARRGLALGPESPTCAPTRLTRS